MTILLKRRFVQIAWMLVRQLFPTHFGFQCRIRVDRTISQFVGGKLGINGEICIGDECKIDVDSADEFNLIRPAFRYKVDGE
jgi:hypothetical protein